MRSLRDIFEGRSFRAAAKATADDGREKIVSLQRRMRGMAVAAAACLCLVTAGGGAWHYQYQNRQIEFR